MFDKEFNIAILIEKFQKGEINIAEQQRLDDWLTADPANGRLLQELMQEAVLKERLSAFHAINEQRAWQKIRYSVRKTERKASVPHTERIVLRKKWARMAIGIAATITLFILGVYIFQTSPYSETPSHTRYLNDVKPGTVGATLTLSDGTSIRLQDVANGELAQEAGVTIRKSQDGQLIYELKETASVTDNIMNTLSTANGETYQVKLPDGTMVWLNAASTLRYPAHFAGQERRVELRGEAYFEVASQQSTSTRHTPFIVMSNRQKVEVLGTHFNMNAYADERSVKTTLLEGSVLVSSVNSGVSRTLLPGQQAIQIADNIQVVPAKSEVAVDWKNGNFVFQSEDIKTIMRKIVRWYNVEVEYKGEPIKTRYTGVAKRSQNVSTILQMLEKTETIRFEIVPSQGPNQSSKVIVINKINH